jgi:hypothetical protein
MVTHSSQRKWSGFTFSDQFNGLSAKEKSVEGVDSLFYRSEEGRMTQERVPATTEKRTV